MRMKLIWCTIWVLSALLIAASLDTAPDPPAVDPLGMAVKVPSPGEHGPAFNWELGSLHYTALVAPVRIFATAFVEESDPDHPGQLIVQAGYAADPSPP